MVGDVLAEVVQIEALVNLSRSVGFGGVSLLRLLRARFARKDANTVIYHKAKCFVGVKVEVKMEVKVGVKHFVLDNTTRAQTIVHERSSLTSTSESELTSSITPHFYSLLIIRLILSSVSIANLTYYVATF